MGMLILRKTKDGRIIVMPESPTEKQVSFAKAIASKLGIDLPEEYSKIKYSIFISENIDRFYSLKASS